jgi:hypothetical protein
MAEYIVGKGVSIHGLGPGASLREGQPVPAGLLAAWGEEGLRAHVQAGSIVAVGGEPTPAPAPKGRK